MQLHVHIEMYRPVLFKGYEPNDPVLTWLAMEMRRGRSLPPGNPFWSERIQAEARLQMARPKDLPLPTVSPEQDLDCLDGMGDGGGEGTSPFPVQGGSRVRSTSKEVRFKTPSLPVSWSSSTTREGQKRAHGSVERTSERSMGKMPEEMLGKRTMGPMLVHPKARGDGLEDAMEKHMVQELMEQNRMLKLEVENLREKLCPEEEKDDRVPDGMRHLQERTMSLEAQVRDLLALQPNGLHRGLQGRDEVPRGDRALHGRGQADCGEDRDWKDQEVTARPESQGGRFDLGGVPRGDQEGDEKGTGLEGDEGAFEEPR